jgi:hypothetical protein
MTNLREQAESQTNIFSHQIDIHGYHQLLLNKECS